jgi:hypothetical protein
MLLGEFDVVGEVSGMPKGVNSLAEYEAKIKAEAEGPMTTAVEE